jgi:hypothetical protein
MVVTQLFKIKSTFTYKDKQINSLLSTGDICMKTKLGICGQALNIDRSINQ